MRVLHIAGFGRSGTTLPSRLQVVDRIMESLQTVARRHG